MKFTVNSILIIVSLLAMAQFTQAQIPYWAQNAGGASGDNRATVCKVGHNGNVVVGGYFTDTADFDFGPGTMNLISNGDRDCFVASYTPAGVLNWAFSFGGPDREAIRDLALDGNDNVLIAGSFRGQNIDVDPSASGTMLLSEVGNSIGAPSDHGEIFFAKYTSSGNYVWAMATGSISEYEYGTAINTDGAGNIYTAGRFHWSIDIDPSPATYMLNSSSGQTCYLAKYTPTGQLIRGFNFGGNSDNFIRGLEIDNNGFVYITGYFQGMNVDFDPSPTLTQNLNATGGNNDLYLAKYDTAFNLQFAFRMGGIGQDEALDLALDTASNIYISGYVGAQAIFDPVSGNPVPQGGLGMDAFIAKYNSAGQYQWAKTIGGPGADLANELRIYQNRIHCTGFFSDSVDFNPGPATAILQSAGGYDAFVTEYDLNGNYSCGFRIGSTLDDFGEAIAVGAAGDVFIVGEFAGTNVDFHPLSATLNLTSNGVGDMYVGRYSGCETPNGVSAVTGTPTITIYPNPSSGRFNVKLDGFEGDNRRIMKLVNALGQTVLEREITQTNISLSADPGIYLLIITDGYQRQVQTRKVLIQ